MFVLFIDHTNLVCSEKSENLKRSVWAREECEWNDEKWDLKMLQYGMLWWYIGSTGTHTHFCDLQYFLHEKTCKAVVFYWDCWSPHILWDIQAAVTWEQERRQMGSDTQSVCTRFMLQCHAASFLQGCIHINVNVSSNQSETKRRKTQFQSHPL